MLSSLMLALYLLSKVVASADGCHLSLSNNMISLSLCIICVYTTLFAQHRLPGICVFPNMESRAAKLNLGFLGYVTRRVEVTIDGIVYALASHLM